MASQWDPGQYGRFADARSRPFHELVGRIAADPETVADLGCGPGELTATLLERWPKSRIVGVDSSAEMLAQAARHARPGRLDFVRADLRDWTPAAPLDAVVSNATLHWTPGHEAVLKRLLSLLKPGGALAFQIPGQQTQPTHTILSELRHGAAWRDRLGALDGVDQEAWPAADYYALLSSWGCAVDAWETIYIQPLKGENAVLEWVKGSTIRPVLSALDAAGQAAFLAEYGALLAKAYPRRPDGTTLLPFRRIFVVATKPA